MGKTSVDIILKAHDQASRNLNRVESAGKRLQGTMKSLVGIAGGAVSLYKIFDFGKSSLEAFREQEKAVMELKGALDLLGDTSPESLKSMEQFASGIQQLTTYGDEAVLSVMALGANISKLSGKHLQQETVAAIGLAKAYRMDLEQAMTLVAKASIGETGSLKRLGIVLDENSTAQEKYNALIDDGVKKFQLAQNEIDTTTGKLQQQKNAWGDLKESVGSYIDSLETRAIPQIQAINEELRLQSASLQKGRWWKHMGEQYTDIFGSWLFGGNSYLRAKLFDSYTYSDTDLAYGKWSSKKDRKDKNLVEDVFGSKQDQIKAVSAAISADKPALNIPGKEEKEKKEKEKLQRVVPQRLGAEESRFLTFAPGTRFNSAEQVARRTEQHTRSMTELLKQLVMKFDRMISQQQQNQFPQRRVIHEIGGEVFR